MPHLPPKVGGITSTACQKSVWTRSRKSLIYAAAKSSSSSLSRFPRRKGVRAHDAPRARNCCRNGFERMPAQRTAGDRPLLGPDDGAVSGNRFDSAPRSSPGISATLAATTRHDAGYTVAQRRAPANHAAQPAAGADVASARHAGYATTPMPATPGTGVSGVPYGYGAPAMTSPPSSYPTPGRAPPSGYSNPDLSPSGSPGSPAATAPGSAPAATYPSSSVFANDAGQFGPSDERVVPLGPSPGSSSPTRPHASANAGRFATVRPPPGYFPPGGYNYDNRNGSIARAPEATGQRPAALRPRR